MKKAFYYLLITAGLCFQALTAAETEDKIKAQLPNVANYQVKNFDHLLGNIQGLDDSLLKMHFKLYEGYVNNSNTLLKKLQELSTNNQSKTPDFAGLKRMLGWEFNGMLLHEYYFENLGKTSFPEPNDPLITKMNEDFGSYDQWKADFVSTGLMRGIGWVVTYVEPKNGRLINEWINEHDLGHLSGATPILVMDVFEHAYITQFGLDRNKYIDIFFNNINWENVSKRFKNIKS
ncbi:Superoxide dismutase [Fe] [Chlamydiales bacterium STE3]|nr:Superoxide dismutase [Fe] [Chlamydiales bacterium STE3]